jgi:hypothetical protein
MSPFQRPVMWLMPFTEIITIYSENHMEPINRLVARIQIFWMLNQREHKVLFFIFSIMDRHLKIFYICYLISCHTQFHFIPLMVHQYCHNIVMHSPCWYFHLGSEDLKKIVMFSKALFYAHIQRLSLTDINMLSAFKVLMLKVGV